MIHSIRTHRRAIAASALLLAMVFILTSVIVTDTDAKTVNQDGMTFSVYDNGTALLVKGEKTLKDLVIPETVISDGQTYTVTGIYQWAFVGSDIETVEIPSTIRNIDNCAFRDCGSLKQVTFSEGLERIGSFCFNDCDMLQTVELPSTLLTLGSKAFAARGLENITVSDSNQAFAVIDGMLVSKDLETLYWYPPNAEQESFTVPSNIYIIGYGAFYGNHNLREITFGENVMYLNHPIEDCSVETINLSSNVRSMYGLTSDTPELRTINVSEGNRWFKTVDGILYTSDMKTLVKSPFGIVQGDYTIPEGVEVIGEYAMDHDPITSISLPSTLVHIEECAFYDTRLTSITMPASVRSIGVMAFADTDISEIVFMGNPSYLADDCFNVIPTRITEHYMDIPVPLEYCVGPGKSVYYQEGYQSLPTAEDESIDGVRYDLLPNGKAEVVGNDDLTGYVTIPETVIYQGYEYKVVGIGQSAFFWSDISGVYIPDTVTKIGHSAFMHSHELMDVRIGDNVEEIENNAFAFCRSLSEIHIPASVSYMYANPFEGCYSLETITVDPDNRRFTSVDDILYTTGCTYMVCYPGGKTDESLTIPDTVVSISAGAIHGNSCLREIMTNEGLLTIEGSAIIDCPSLSRIVISSSVQEITAPLARFCYNLQSIEVVGGNSSYLTKDGVLFRSDMSELVRYPSAIRTVTYYVPEGVETISLSAMNGSDVSTVILPEGLISLGKYSFQDSKINSVIIPSSVEKIWDGAFYDSDLSEVTFLGVPDAILESAFESYSPELTEYYAVEVVPLEDVCGSVKVRYVPYSGGPIEERISGTISEDTVFAADVNVIVTDDLTISGCDVVIHGTFYLSEGAEIILDSSSLTLNSQLTDVPAGDIWGSITVSEGSTLRFADDAVGLWGSVTVRGEFTIGSSSIDTESGNWIMIESGGSLSIPATDNTYSEDEMVILYSVYNHGSFTVGSGRTVAVGIMTILGSGSLDVSGGTEQGYILIGALQSGFDYVNYVEQNLGSNVSLSGPMDVRMAMVFTNTVMDDMAEQSFSSLNTTCFMIGDILWMTAYSTEGSTDFILYMFERIPLENAWFNGIWRDAEGNDVNNLPIGTDATSIVYADVRYDVYNITVSPIQGVKGVLIDGTPMEKTSSGSYHASVAMGTHRINCVMESGGSPPLDLTVNGVPSTGPLFTTKGTPTSSQGIDYDIVIIPKYVDTVTVTCVTVDGISEIPVLSGTAISDLPAPPSLTGYRFVCWIDGETNRYDDDAKITADIVLFPCYERISSISSDFEVYMKRSGGDLDVMITSSDGGSIGGGTVNLSFYYTEYDSFVGDYATKVRNVKVNIPGSDQTRVTVSVDIPSDLNGLYAASSVFTSNGSSDGSGTIFC